MRHPIVAGNWKMNGTLAESRQIVEGVSSALRRQPDRFWQEIELVLCPPFTALTAVSALLKGSPIQLGAQNAHWESKGAYTGEISPLMLKEIGCRYVILGHSERRAHFRETDAEIHKKLNAVIAQGLNAILCVGETLQEREEGHTWSVVQRQLERSLEGLDPAVAAQRLVIAYEPVWAIGTGRNATPIQAQEVHQKIRAWLAGRLGKPAAEGVRIQYGGSVKPDNAAELMAQPDLDGALVGGASLDPKSFVSIIESTVQTKGVPCSTRSS